MESQYKALADYVIVNKKRVVPPPPLRYLPATTANSVSSSSSSSAAASTSAATKPTAQQATSLSFESNGDSALDSDTFSNQKSGSFVGLFNKIAYGTL